MNLHGVLTRTVVNGIDIMVENIKEHPLGVTREEIPKLLERNESVAHIAVVDVVFVPNSATAQNLKLEKVSFEGRYAVYQAFAARYPLI